MGGRRSTVPTFVDMLSRVLPGASAPWNSAVVDAARAPRHLRPSRRGRAAGAVPAAARPAVFDRLRAACRPDFLWEAADERSAAVVPGTRRRPRRLPPASAATRTSRPTVSSASGCSPTSTRACRRSARRSIVTCSGRRAWSDRCSISKPKPPARARTGIGCFFDDPVHDVLGLRGHAFQSLYHFTVGMPVDDARLTTEPGYPWEKAER